MLFRFLALVLTVSLGAVAHGAQTGFTGSGQSFANEQPSLGLQYLVRLSGTPDELGEVSLFASSFAPQGWAKAEGQLLPISQNNDLFSKLGTSFGGDGESTFRLPDLRGRTPIGAGQGIGLPSYSLGQLIGSQQQTLSAPPAHSHGIGASYQTESAGAMVSHSNMQPSLALTPVIALQGVFPSRDSLPADGEVAAGLSSSGADPYVGEIAWLAHDEVPDGWAKAEGQLLPISQHDALFSLLGTEYGGNGETNFKLPDLRGRGAVGTGPGVGLTSRPLGSSFGEHEETLTESQLPNHFHLLPSGGATQFEGGLQSQSNVQPSLAITHAVSLEGIYPSQSAPAADEPSQAPGGSSDPYYASISTFAFNFAPRDFAEAGGQSLPISQNTALFSLLGTTFGGDGESTFGLPDLRGRLPVGVGSGSGLGPVISGERFGQESSNLTVGNLPSHAHTFTVPGDYNDDGRVDAADYAVWRNHLGDPAGTLQNDTTGVAIGQQQYDLWRTQYGAPFQPLASSQASSPFAIPEPAALVLAALFSVAGLPGARRRCSRR